MDKNVLEFRPSDGNHVPIVNLINNPMNNLFVSLVNYIDFIVDQRVNEKIEKGFFEKQPLEMPTEVKPQQLIKAKELAKHLRFAESTINDMADRGEIPCRKRTRGKKTFRRFELDKVLAALEVK